MKTVFDYVSNREGSIFPNPDVPFKDPSDQLPDYAVRSKLPRIPGIAEPQLVRHYTSLSKLNYGVDDGFYPLGSCTMKYNPKVNEDLANLKGFSDAHPNVSVSMVQGTLKLLHAFSCYLRKMSGMTDVSLQPVAGAHGELTGMFILRKYFQERDENRRKRILLPDSAHGTNPASAATAGFSVTELPSGDDGMIDVDALEETLDETVAGIMLTVPNTLGIFEERVLRVTELVHNVGGLCYFDGANLNAFLGRARPGDMGADIFHFNLHKTLSTPHGGGGPGAGPIAVSRCLADFLPVPRIVAKDDGYDLDWDYLMSIGSVHSFYGNFAVILKAFAYLLMLGDEGLRKVSGDAVLNANYLQELLRETYALKYDGRCKHEFVLSGRGTGAKTLDIAKRLIDYGFHPPTIYFPLIVKEAMMIEPTESEGKQGLDDFAEAMERIANEAAEDFEKLTEAPVTTPVRRLDQTKAVREPVFSYPFD